MFVFPAPRARSALSGPPRRRRGARRVGSARLSGRITQEHAWKKRLVGKRGEEWSVGREVAKLCQLGAGGQDSARAAGRRRWGEREVGGGGLPGKWREGERHWRTKERQAGEGSGEGASERLAGRRAGQ
jgi:hypothetical protein